LGDFGVGLGIGWGRAVIGVRGGVTKNMPVGRWSAKRRVFDKFGGDELQKVTEKEGVADQPLGRRLKTLPSLLSCFVSKGGDTAQEEGFEKVRGPNWPSQEFAIVSVSVHFSDW